MTRWRPRVASFAAGVALGAAAGLLQAAGAPDALPQAGSARPGAAEPADAPDFIPPTVRQRCAPALASRPVVALRGRAAALLGERGVRQPQAWADATLQAVCAAGLPLRGDVVALVFAFVERESGFVAHGLLPNQPDALRKLGYRLIDDLLAARSDDLERLVGKETAARMLAAGIESLQSVGLLDRDRLRRLFDRYHHRFGWHRVGTEWALENVVARDVLAIAEETSAPGLALRTLLALVPRWGELLRAGTLLHSVGAMQVEPASAVAIAAGEGVALDERRARALLYTLEGGLYYGVRRLQPTIAAQIEGGPIVAATASVAAADWRLGPWASRDAALAHQIARLAGQSLPPTAALRSNEVKALLLALERDLAAPATDGRPFIEVVDRFLEQAGRPQLVQTAPYERIRMLYRQRFREEPAPFLIPERRFYSAKTGGYRLREVVDDTRRRFERNCQQLGCRS